MPKRKHEFDTYQKCRKIVMIMTFVYKNLDIYLEDQEGNLVVKANGLAGEPIQETVEFPQKLVDPQAYSDEIGKALFPGKIFQLYMNMLQETYSSRNQGIKIKLHFADQKENCQEFPWEGVRINNNFVVLDPRQTIVRTIDISDPTISLAVEKLPYRILALAPSPRDLSHLESAQEIEQIRTALSPMIEKNLIQIEIYQGNVTFAKVADLLAQKEFHFVHFVGSARGNNLIFCGDDGMSDPIDSLRLGIMLRGTEVKLLFLNTMIGPQFAEVLLRSGLPIVIGNHGKLHDAAAVPFAAKFYIELVRTSSVEKAICSARRKLSEYPNLGEFEWANYYLYSIAVEDKFWVGEAGYKIETFINNGQLITEAKPLGAFNAAIFANRLQTVINMMGQIKNSVDQAKIRNLVAETQDAIYQSDEKVAVLKLSEASTHTILTIEKEDIEEKQKKSESRARQTVLWVAVSLLVTVVVLVYIFRDVWTATTIIPVIALPISIVVWSFIGGVAAMLQAFVGTKKDAKQINYEWLLWRPVVGVIMGSVLYLAVSAGLAVLGQSDVNTINSRGNFFLWTLAFLGGFSDKFAILVFDNIVRTLSKPSEQISSGKEQKTSIDKED